ncbi:MAG: hypothetical protein ACYC1I_01075 [Acidimicrobiales bacterium]
MAGVEATDSDSMVESPQRLKGAPALRAHAMLVGGLAFCGLAFWFELKRALGGNGLSWAYVFEWPLLGGFAVYMWWSIIHPDREKTKKRSADEPSVAPQFNSMLVAWEERQRDLAVAQEAHDQTLKSGDDAPW